MHTNSSRREMQPRVRQAFKRLGDETQTQAASSFSHSKDIEVTTGSGTRWLIIDAGKERNGVGETWARLRLSGNWRMF